MSGRGPVPVATPHPLGRLLPGLYLEKDELDRIRGKEPFAHRLTDGLDAVLAPILCVLDCLEAYVDPRLAPADFVAWLASSLGVETDRTLPLERQREVLRHAASAYSHYGTRRGIVEAVRAVAGSDPVVDDSGGVSWSTDARAEPPVPLPPTVEVRLPSSATTDRDRIDRTIADAKPAHVAHTLTILDAETHGEPS